MALTTKGTEEFDNKLEEALSKISPDANKEGEGTDTSAPNEGVTPDNETVPQEGQTVEKTEGEEAKPAEAPTFDLETFNKQFGSEFADFDSLKGSLNRLNDLQEYDTIKSEHDALQEKLNDLQAKYEEAKGLLDPRKHFVNEAEYKRQLILQQHGQELNSALLNKVIDADFDKMDDMDVLAFGELVANPNILGGEEGAKAMIYKQLGVDPDLERDEWDMATRNVVAKAAYNQRKELKKIRDIEVPEQVDYETQRTEREQQAEQTKEQLKSKWGSVAVDMVDKFRTIDLQRETKDGKSEVYFSYDVGDDFRKNATELVLGYLIDNGLEPTKDNVQDAQSYVRDLFWRSHGPDVVQAYGKDVEAKLIEKYNIEQDNPKPPNDSEAPTGDLDKANQELMDYVKEDLGSSRKPGDKLFSNT